MISKINWICDIHHTAGVFPSFSQCLYCMAEEEGTEVEELHGILKAAFYKQRDDYYEN